MILGYASTSNQFINNERAGSIDFDDAIILVTDESISAVDQIMPTLQIAARDRRPLLIVSNDMEGQALAALIANVNRPAHANPMAIAAVKAPKYGEERRQVMKDLCVSTGATFITREKGLTLREVGLNHLGQAKKINIIKGWTTIIGGKGNAEEIDTRIEAVKTEIRQTDDLLEVNDSGKYLPCSGSRSTMEPQQKSK